MKRAILSILILLTFTLTAHAESHNKSGIKLDAPNIVKITDSLSLGAEVGKDVFNDIFYPDSKNYVEADKGYFGYVKLVWTGSLINLTD